MNAISQFQLVWNRCDELKALAAFLRGKTTGIVNVDELLRAEWVARVSALDLYMHELIAQKMVDTFSGTRPVAAGFLRFALPSDVLMRVKTSSAADQVSAFDLEVRNKLSILSYQDPEKIADGVRLISDLELWRSIAATDGLHPSRVQEAAKGLKLQLSAIITRRNKIAHEGDLKPGIPREAWPISPTDVEQVEIFLLKLVRRIDTLLG